MTTRPRQAAIIAAVVALGLALAPGAPAGARSTGFVLEGSDCVELVAALAVPAANVADDVPDGYAISTVNGMATLGIGVLRCAAADVDGAPAGRVLVSDVGVGIAAPAGCANPCDGAHFYQLWQVTDSHLLHARMSGLGVAGAFVSDMSLETESLPGALVSGVPVETGTLPGLTEAKGLVQWAAAPYGLATRTAGPAPAGPLAGTPNWWHGTRKGAARIRYSFPGYTTLGAGGGTVEAAAGTRMADLLGQERQDGAGLLITASRIRGEAGRE